MSARVQIVCNRQISDNEPTRNNHIEQTECDYSLYAISDIPVYKVSNSIELNETNHKTYLIFTTQFK